jgi:uncharacterized membrane protein YbhN (UPF0104 family)
MDAPLPGARSPRRWRRWLWPAVGIAFFTLIAALLADYVRDVRWSEVGRTLAAYPAHTLAAAAALALLSHVTYACYDLIGRDYARHDLPASRVLGVAFISYAFNLNLGSLVGGVGLRLRLYHRLGLGVAQIGRIIALSLVTNWSGWTLLTGTALVTRAVSLPQASAEAIAALQALGGLLLACPIAYVVLCLFSRRRIVHLRGQAFRLPTGLMALAQVGVSSLNWMLIGAILWVLMPAGLAYPRILATHLSAAILAVTTHIPGGLGVIEAVFVAALGDFVEQGGLIAALLAYRALYYLVPLAVATALHFGLEASASAARRGRQPASGPA